MTLLLLMEGPIGLHRYITRNSKPKVINDEKSADQMYRTNDKLFLLQGAMSKYSINLIIMSIANTRVLVLNDNLESSEETQPL